MSDLLESYLNKIEVAKENIRITKMHYDDVVKNYLCNKLSDEKVVQFISDNVFMVLHAIACIKKDNYVIGCNGYDFTELYINESDILDTFRDFLTKDLYKELDKEIDMIERVIETFYEKNGNYEVTNFTFGITPKKGFYICFTDYDTEYGDEWSYYENYIILKQYKYFYQRLETLMRKHIRKIVLDNINCISRGLFDLILQDYDFREIIAKHGFKDDKSIYDPDLPMQDRAKMQNAYIQEINNLEVRQVI